MPQDSNSRWRKHVRRILYLAGTATSIYVLLSYALDRMREARIRALKERKEKDLLKNHFTSLTSTITFTLYALLPTLQPQLSAEYPVEATSQALQGFSAPSSSAAESSDPTPDSSMVLQPPEPNLENGQTTTELVSDTNTSEQSVGVEQSWSSEFRTESVAESEQPSLVGDSMIQARDDDAESSTMSQSISLPPTDVSSFSPSPPSDRSPLQQSPPQPHRVGTSGSIIPTHKTKKELWRDLKMQTLTRTITTAYLIPLVYLLTCSQLSTLARIRYLADVKSSLSPTDEDGESDVAPRRGKRTDLWSYFSTDSMGLGDFVEADGSRRSGLLNPTRYLPTVISQYIPFTGLSRPKNDTALETPEVIRAKEEALEVARAEDERVYLMYSWWILHEGWRSVAKRVEMAVEDVFGRMALKRELSISDWENLFRQVRVEVETQETIQGTSLYSFLSDILPPNPMPELTTSDANPLPDRFPTDRPHLASLLEQTKTHLASADATFLIEKGVTSMHRKLLEALREESYSGSEIGLILGEEHPQLNMARRLVDCLPAIDRWGKGVWEGIPDSGIENLTSIPEFEGFAALIFGDWAPKLD